MASKRDRLKQLNQSQEIKNTEQGTTIVDELIEQYENQAPPVQSIDIKIPNTDAVPAPDLSGELIEVIDRSRAGRPKILEGVYKPISARLKLENYEFARKSGGKYGGMNAYINYLIEQDMKRALQTKIEE